MSPLPAGKFWVWTAGMCAALGIGPAQSLIRAAVGSVIPSGRSAEIFGVMESLNTLGDIFGNVAPERWVNTDYRYVYALSLPFLVLAFAGIALTPMGNAFKDPQSPPARTEVVVGKTSKSPVKCDHCHLEEGSESEKRKREEEEKREEERERGEVLGGDSEVTQGETEIIG
ncbi:hypothetical protein KIPB_010942 [Kipferlia bialata]|uniref:Major facilitator superfamily (MFS) profile domain-containing protein n=1 Tax=Kipferlia bialata TaxID=797122 RepID=A0A9K3D6L9_9EUKA|nr:hypothetical protein KIPB_010942 [Kipferlia bialata]|eukprot:g10942.t1